MSDWRKALQSAIASDCDKVPAGFKTTNEWSVEMKLSPGRTREIFRRLGVKADRKNFKVSVNGYPPRPTPHYRLI